MAALVKGRPIRQPDAAHPDLFLHPEGSIADARNDMAKMRQRPPLHFMSLFAEANPGDADAPPAVNFKIDLSKATREQLAVASAHASEVVPVVDTIEAHQAKLDARLDKLRELMQADASAGKVAQSPMSQSSYFSGVAPTQPEPPRAQGFQSFTPQPDAWSGEAPGPSPFGSPFGQMQPYMPAVPPIPPPFAPQAFPQTAPARDAFPSPFAQGPPAPPPFPFAAQKAASAPSYPSASPPTDLRPTESATFYFPQGAFPGNYHHIDVQRAADGRPVAVYLVYDNRFGVAPPFMATDVEGEFGLAVKGAREYYTVEATCLLHEFLNYTIGVLMINQVHAVGERG